jgi:hypothetical protein
VGSRTPHLFPMTIHATTKNVAFINRDNMREFDYLVMGPESRLDTQVYVTIVPIANMKAVLVIPRVASSEEFECHRYTTDILRTFNVACRGIDLRMIAGDGFSSKCRAKMTTFTFEYLFSNMPVVLNQRNMFFHSNPIQRTPDRQASRPNINRVRNGGVQARRAPPPQRRRGPSIGMGAIVPQRDQVAVGFTPDVVLQMKYTAIMTSIVNSRDDARNDIIHASSVLSIASSILDSSSMKVLLDRIHDLVYEGGYSFTEAVSVEGPAIIKGLDNNVASHIDSIGNIMSECLV